MRLCSYKMTYDTGFAPNPFGSTLTLATCKPDIRRCKQKGDWIAGFTSAELCKDKVGEERLVYLMRVGEKIKLADYHHDPRFHDKIPDNTKPGSIAKAGDNIYRPLGPNATEPFQFEQVENINHWGSGGPSREHLIEDISGQYVLAADEFYYFGRNALVLPAELRPNVPTSQAQHGWWTPGDRAEALVAFIRSRFEPGRHGTPHDWPTVTDTTLESVVCG
jgi:hypothetical protein